MSLCVDATRERCRYRMNFQMEARLTAFMTQRRTHNTGTPASKVRRRGVVLYLPSSMRSRLLVAAVACATLHIVAAFLPPAMKASDFVAPHAKARHGAAMAAWHSPPRVDASSTFVVNPITFGTCHPGPAGHRSKKRCTGRQVPPHISFLPCEHARVNFAGGGCVRLGDCV